MLRRLNNILAKIFLIIFITGTGNLAYSEENKAKFLKNTIFLGGDALK